MKYNYILALSLIVLIQQVSSCKDDQILATSGKCVYTCRPEEFLDIAAKKCLAKKTDCTGYVMMEKKVCIQSCPVRSIPVQKENYSTCKFCEKYVSADGKSCVDKCEILNLQDQTCLSKLSDCQGVISQKDNIYVCSARCEFNYYKVKADGYEKCEKCQENYTSNGNSYECLNCEGDTSFYFEGQCVANCDEGTYIFKVENTNSQICLKDCPQSYLISIQNKSCVQKCSENEIEQIINFKRQCVPLCQDSTKALQAGQCINKEDCKLNLSVLTEDNLICAEKCLPGQYPQLQENASYQLCVKCPDGEYLSKESKCVEKCEDSIPDETQGVCISNIKDCKGVITIDSTKCLKECPEGQQVDEDESGLKRCKNCASDKEISIKGTCITKCSSNEYYDITGDFTKIECATSCNDSKFIVKIFSVQLCVEKCPEEMVLSSDGRTCAKSCPGNEILDKQNKKCLNASDCKGVLSENGTVCLITCPNNQFITQNGKSSPKCKKCEKIVSSDGKSCVGSCEANELTDVTQKKCVTQCGDNQFLSEARKTCSNECKKGEIADKTTKKCLAQKSSCDKYISSDQKYCIDKCQEGEIIVAKDTLQFCVRCPYLLSSDAQSCVKECLEGEVIDVDKGICLKSASECTKLLSSDQKKCSEKCIFPEKKPSNPDAKICSLTCADDEVYSTELGCIKSADCQGYISSDGGYCLENCYKKLEIVDPLNPQHCKKCDEGQFPKLVTKDKTKSIECVTPTAEEDTENNSNKQKNKEELKNSAKEKKDMANSIKDIIKDSIGSIPAEQKQELKQQIENISTNISDTIKQLKTSSEVTKDEKNQEVKDIMKSIMDLVNQFVTKTDSSTVDDFQFSVKSELFNIISEKKKPGFYFKKIFKQSDFNQADTSSGDQVSLQEESTTNPDVNDDLDQLSTTNLEENHYCTDEASCGDSPLFIVEATVTTTTVIDPVTGGRRNLEASSVNFQVTFDLKSDPSKTICVTYNDATGQMSPSINTQADADKKSITCTFVGNTSLYIDQNCSLVDKSICESTQESTTGDDDDGLSGGAIAGIVIGIVAGLALVGASIFYWRRKQQSKGSQYQQTSKPVVEYSDVELKGNNPQGYVNPAQNDQ